LLFAATELLLRASHARRRLLQCEISVRSMSALGQKQTSRPAWTMSVLPPKADIERALIRLVPQENELGTVFGCG